MSQPFAPFHPDLTTGDQGEGMIPPLCNFLHLLAHCLSFIFPSQFEPGLGPGKQYTFLKMELPTESLTFVRRKTVF